MTEIRLEMMKVVRAAQNHSMTPGEAVRRIIEVLSEPSEKMMQAMSAAKVLRTSSKEQFQAALKAIE